jgi:hypothetical protein
LAIVIASESVQSALRATHLGYCAGWLPRFVIGQGTWREQTL